jgi:hypothetical protein
MSLSTIVAADLITELSSDADFDLLSESEKIQLINSASQQVCNIYFDNKRADYKGTNLAAPLPAFSVNLNERAGFSTASILGIPVSFTSPFGLPYMLTLIGYKDGLEYGIGFFNPIGGTDTRTADGFTAFAAEDGVTIEYRAFKPV